MKPAAIALPAITLLAAGIWLGSQHHSISALEKQSEVLKKRIAAHDAAPVALTTPGRPSRDKNPEKAAKEKIDWKGVAEQFATMQRQGGVSDMRAMMRFQHQLQEMTTDDLLAALDEIATLDLPKESLAMLEQMLITPLAQKEPELALNRFVGQLGDNNGQALWSMSSAMKEWSKKDASAAAAWLDQQIATGKLDSKSLDGKSRSRSMFEGNLISGMLATDPDAASKRLETLPEAQRAEALRIASSPLKEERQADFAKMVREQLPENERLNAIAQLASRIATAGEYADVNGYIERISASPEERTAIVKEAAEDKLRTLSYNKKITRAEVDTMRDWAISQDKNSADKITGTALAQAGQQQREDNNFKDLADLAVHYHEASGNDEVIVSFLQNTYSPQNKEKARELAEKVSDPKRREELLNRFK